MHFQRFNIGTIKEITKEARKANLNLVMNLELYNLGNPQVQDEFIFEIGLMVLKLSDNYYLADCQKRNRQIGVP